MFSFEAGRRCDSGPGNFTFETKQGNEIFSLVDQSIKLQKDLEKDRHLSGPQSYDPDCPLSLQHIRNAVPGGVTSGSGDSSSCSSREADGDSGGSKPGSADGVLGKREGGDGGGGGGGKGQGGGAGLKGRSLPEPPGMLGVLGGGGTPPRSPRGKGVSSPDENAGLYSEPVDSVRMPAHSSDGLYSDPVDSIKVQNQTSNPCTPPVPTPRNRPTGDDVSGCSVPGDHHPGLSNPKKVPDLYSHVYDQIGQDLNQKTSALNLNGGVGGGRGAGRGKNNKKRTGGKAEGSPSPPDPSLDHIYDEPEGCATVQGHLGMTVYDEARLEPPIQRRQEETGGPTGPEGTYSNSSKGKPSEPQRQSPKQLGPNRGTPQSPAPRWPKPATAPKPNKGLFAKKEPVPPPPGKQGSNVNNNNNVWSAGGSGKEVYSIVSKQKPPPAHLWYKQNRKAPLRSPDIIYDNLGDI